MPEYSDIYVISEERDTEVISDFLDHFLSQREDSADEYEFPQYSDDPSVIYKKDSEILARCVEDKTAEYGIYWRAIDNQKPEHAMVFFLRDGNVIYGLSTDASDQQYAHQLLTELKELLGSKLGYIGHEASPNVESIDEFKIQIEVHTP